MGYQVSTLVCFPMSCILGSLSNVLSRTFYRRADVGDAITQWSASLASDSGYSLADPARGSSNYTADCIGNSGECVTENCKPVVSVFSLGKPCLRGGEREKKLH